MSNTTTPDMSSEELKLQDAIVNVFLPLFDKGITAEYKAHLLSQCRHELKPLLQEHTQAAIDTAVEQAKFDQAEYICSCMSEQSSTDDDLVWEDAAKLVDDVIVVSMPKGHADYWKHHCVTCGLLLNGEPEEEGYCQCE